MPEATFKPPVPAAALAAQAAAQAQASQSAGAKTQGPLDAQSVAREARLAEVASTYVGDDKRKELLFAYAARKPAFLRWALSERRMELPESLRHDGNLALADLKHYLHSYAMSPRAIRQSQGSSGAWALVGLSLPFVVGLEAAIAAHSFFDASAGSSLIAAGIAGYVSTIPTVILLLMATNELSRANKMDVKGGGGLFGAFGALGGLAATACLNFGAAQGLGPAGVMAAVAALSMAIPAAAAALKTAASYRSDQAAKRKHEARITELRDALAAAEQADLAAYFTGNPQELIDFLKSDYTQFVAREKSNIEEQRSRVLSTIEQLRAEVEKIDPELFAPAELAEMRAQARVKIGKAEEVLSLLEQTVLPRLARELSEEIPKHVGTLRFLMSEQAALEDKARRREETLRRMKELGVEIDAAAESAVDSVVRVREVFTGMSEIVADVEAALKAAHEVEALLPPSPVS